MDSFERLNENDEHVKLILEYSKHWLQGKKLTTFNVMELVTKLIPHTQKVMNEKGLGPKKKKVIMTVLLILSDKLNFTSQKEKEQIITVIEETIPSTIDIMIGISKGEIDFQKIIKHGGIYTKLFSSCCGKKNESKPSLPSTNSKKVSDL